jgi:xylulokinase
MRVSLAQRSKSPICRDQGAGVTDYLLGVDVGSSDCKVTLIDAQGRVVASSAQPYPTHYPRLGWAEQDPQDWYDAACHAIRSALTAGNIRPESVAALSIDGPAHNVALLDAAGRIIRPTLHWSDLRSTPQSERLARTHGDRIFELSCCQVSPTWTLAQLLWLKENELEHWARLRRILVTKDYVRYRFTGQYQTDVYDAIGTQLYAAQTAEWSDELCDLIGFNPDWLPPVSPATSISGPLLAEAAQDAGLCAGIPVAVGSGDSVVEALGIGAVQPGQGIVKLGTAANVNLVTARPLPSRQSITYRHVVEPHWFSITATNAGASTMRWFRDTFCRLEVQQAQGSSVYALIDQLAAGAAAGSEGLLFHPYLMGERTPHWDPHLRGSFSGLRAGHGIQHFARAILEGVAFSIRDCLHAVQQLGQPVEQVFLIGGGAKSRLWRQVICDVLGQPLVKPEIEDAALGAAVLAGQAIGMIRDWTGVSGEVTLQPNPETRVLYDQLFDLYREFAQDLIAHSHRLAHIMDDTGKNV